MALNKAPNVSETRNVEPNNVIAKNKLSLPLVFN